jgi:hypothetical protein
MSKIRTEIVTLVFFDARRIIMIKYAPSKQTVNQQFYIKVLTKLQARIRRKKKDQICGVVVVCCNKTTRQCTKRCGPTVFNRKTNTNARTFPALARYFPCDCILFAAVT